MAYTNNNGQIRVGVRPAQTITSSLLQSIYGVWNAETTTTTLATGAYGAWNGEGILSGTQLSASMSNAWQGNNSAFSSTNYSTITASMSNLWKADNNFNDSIGGLTGSSPNSGATPTFITGKFGQAFSFDGVNDYVTLPTGSLKFTGDFSISMWVKATSWNTPRTLISNADINSVGNKWNGWWLDVGPSGKLSFIQVNNGTYNNSLTSFIALVPGVWSLVTVTRSSTRSTIYINGTNVGSVVNTISIGYSTTNFPCIGVNNYLSGIFQGWFVGSLEEIGIWQKSLTDNEVIGLYENGNGQSYPYSNPTTLVLDSYGTGHGIIKGATFSTGKVGTAFSFDGSSYVDLPIGTLNKTADFSVALWVYPTVNNTTMSLISCRDGVKGWNIEYVSGNLWFWAGSGSNIQLQTGHAISLNTWTHILITFKAGVSTKSYINGVLTNTVSLVGKPSVYDNYSPYYLPLLGARRYQNPYTVSADQQAFFTGKIDAIGLWDRELTSSEASAIYNGGSGNEYPFSNASVSSPADSVSTNHGTIVGGVTYTQGVVGNAFTFNGSSNYVALPNSSFDFTGDFSISAWVKIPSAPSVAGYIFSNYNYDFVYNYGYLFGVNTNRTISFGVYGDAGSSVVTSTTALALNTWYHVTVKRDSVDKRSDLYINGVFEAQSPVSAVIIAYGTRAIQPTIGAIRQNNQGTLSTNSYLNGQVDALTIWNKKITDDEITQLYNLGGGIQYPFTTQTIKTPYAVYNGDNLIDPIGAKNATINGGVTYSAGKIGNAYTFDGTTGYLTLPVGSLNLAGSFSFSMWLYFNGTPTGYNTIISNTILASYQGFVLVVISGSLQMQLGNGTGTWPQINGPSVSEFTNKWGHVTFVWEQGVGMKFYLNGVLHNSVANTTTQSYTGITTAPMIGKLTGGGWSLLNGSIDGLTFWNSALTPPEILTMFNDGTGMEYPYSSTLPAKLPSFTDVFTTNHGTSPATSAPTFTTGKFGKAFRFDGVNDHILLPSTALKFTEDFSVSLWVYIPTNSATNQSLIGCQRMPSIWTGWNIELYQNSIYFAFGTGSARKSYAYTNNSNIGAWKHITATFKNGTGGKLYIDGTLQGTITTTSPIVYDSVHTPSIGAMKYAPNTTWYVQNGTKMDAISTWTKELTETEITDLYNLGNGKQYPNY